MGYTPNQSNFTFSSLSWRKSGVWRDNEQFLMHEAALGTVAQIVENGLIRFGKRSFNTVNFQRPDWVCGSFYTALKLPGLVEITNLDKRGENFFRFSQQALNKMSMALHKQLFL